MTNIDVPVQRSLNNDLESQSVRCTSTSISTTEHESTVRCALDAGHYDDHVSGDRCSTWIQDGQSIDGNCSNSSFLRRVKAEEQRDAAISELKEARAQEAALRSALEPYAWERTPYVPGAPKFACRRCGGARPSHDDECEVGAALSGATGRVWAEELRAMLDVISRIGEWTHTFGADLVPKRADTYGDGMREAKSVVAKILEAVIQVHR